MIAEISEKISSFILSNSDNSNKELKSIYKYGIEIFISSLLNIFLIFIIGFVTDTLIQSLWFLICFIPLRQFTGGWHANTYFKCNLIFCISYILIILFSFLFSHIENAYLIFILLLTGLLPVIILSPVENKNKKIKNRKKLKFLSTVLYIIFSITSLCFYFFYKEISFIILFTLLCVSIAVIAGRLSEVLQTFNRQS